MGSGRVERTHITMFSFDETMDVGADTGSPVTADYGPADPGFPKAIKRVRIDTGDDDHSHLIPAEEHLKVIMSRRIAEP